MEYFGDASSDVDYVRKNMPPRTKRFSSSFWENQNGIILNDELIGGEELNVDTEDESEDTTRDEWQRNVVMILYLRVLSCVAESVCGPEGASASLARFTKWLPRYAGDVSTDKTIDTIAPAAQAWTATKPRSTERRVIRALLCETFPRASLQEAKGMFHNFYMSKHSYYKGRNDFAVLIETGSLPNFPIPKQSFDSAAVDDAVSSILSAGNVAYLSWGTKRIVLDGKAHDVPAIARRRTVQLMYNSYLAAQNKDTPLPKSTFYRVCKIWTYGEVHARQAVEYVTGFLINDNFEVLERIIAELLPLVSVSLLKRFENLKAWLKYDGFCSVHSIHEGMLTCPRHDANFGLALSPDKTTNTRRVTCAACVGADNLLQELKRRVEGADTDSSTLQVVKDAHEKIKLFMGHRLRVLNQQKHLQKVADEMKQMCADKGCSDEAIVVIDYKMKFDPQYFREKTVDHYGKRGMTWHGVIVRFWQMEQTSDGADAVETKLYFDHIAADDNKQDKESAAAFVRQ